MKYIVLLGDGMSDEPLPDRGNKTPLQLARTAAMDRLARCGQLGLAATIPPGMAPGSDVANLSVLGYDPARYYTGRAPIEAASIGVPLGPRDIALRCNLVTLAGEGTECRMEDYSAGHIPTPEAAELIEWLRPHLECDDISLHAGVSYRHLLVWKNGREDFTTTPPHDISGRPVAGHLPEGPAADRVRALMERSRELLSTCPVNERRRAQGASPVSSIWLWGQGTALSLPAFREVYGLRGSVISAVDLVKGLGICAGLRSIDVPGATGYLDTNYDGKVSAALDALSEDDFLYLHVEAPDEASHKGSLEEKIQAIEEFDARIVAPVLAGLQEHGTLFRVMVLPDHPTPLATRTHSCGAVPFVICSSADLTAGRESSRDYCEADAEATGLRLADGWKLMGRLIAPAE